MKNHLFFGILLLLFLSPAESRAADLREITARVVDEDNQPVAGAPVILLGLDRGPMTSRSDIFPEPGDANARKSKGWKFVTDADGRCTVTFGKFDFWEHLKTADIIEPGYGSYFLIVEKEGYAGGVSPKLLNFNDADHEAYVPITIEDSGPVEGEEWDYDARLLSDDPKDLEPVEIVLKRGIEVSGELRDENGHPIRGEDVSLWNNLGADTHTGRGGEIFERNSVTDRKGHFQFQHVYPNLFHIALQSQDDDSLCWIKTRVRQRWVDGVHDAVWPHTDDTNLPLVIVASRKLPYHYTGKVTDERGRAVSGATVAIQASIHGPGEQGDFEDDYSHHSHAITRKDGRYDVPSAGAYVNWFAISAPGFVDYNYMEDGEIKDFNRYEEVPCAPGPYDFSLTRKSADALKVQTHLRSAK